MASQQWGHNVWPEPQNCLRMKNARGDVASLLTAQQQISSCCPLFTFPSKADLFYLSDLTPWTLHLTHCFSHNRSSLLFRQSRSLLPQELCIAVLSAWSPLFLGINRASSLHLLQVFTQTSPADWRLLIILSKTAALFYPHKRNFCLVSHCILLWLEQHLAQIECATNICGTNVWITFDFILLILLFVFALKK